MIRPIPPLQDAAGHASHVLVHMDGAGSQPGVSTDNCLLSVQTELREHSKDQLETELLIEMRYQQHLAQKGLQELFENGQSGLLGS